MKIKDLDRNEVYDLTEIKKDSAKFDLLKEWLKENDRDWDDKNIEFLNDEDCIVYSTYHKVWDISSVKDDKPTKCALTLFDLDITDYQVDCSELSKEQIEEMAEVVKGRGYKLWDNENALNLTDLFKYFKYYDDEGFFIICRKVDSKTTITYDKFIELFGEKPIEQSVEELADAFEEKPSQYQIGIDTFTRAESNMTKDEILACVRFNLDKYTWRKKGQDKEDFEKIIAYAQWGLKQLK